MTSIPAENQGSKKTTRRLQAEYLVSRFANTDRSSMLKIVLVLNYNGKVVSPSTLIKADLRRLSLRSNWSSRVNSFPHISKGIYRIS
uniref:Uncharacterized protein n=1 Tax=Salix viminalis TaxID=40686 RepID=A0A6N2M6F9_SALVM